MKFNQKLGIYERRSLVASTNNLYYLCAAFKDPRTLSKMYSLYLIYSNRRQVTLHIDVLNNARVCRSILQSHLKKMSLKFQNTNNTSNTICWIHKISRWCGIDWPERNVKATRICVPYQITLNTGLCLGKRVRDTWDTLRTYVYLNLSIWLINHHMRIRQN